ncbi:MAG: enolase C-terminal domain-like protein [Thermodesulfovibrionales bacterium]
MLLAAAREKIGRIEARAYTLPTDRPESDGTLAWDSTTIVVVRVEGGGRQGTGYSYTSPGAVAVIQGEVAAALLDQDVMETGRCRRALDAALRNLGGAGIAQMAASAVMAALLDLKARLLEIPLATLLGACRESIPVYGSGGFTSYTLHELAGQLGKWADEGISMVKMKIGRNPKADPERIRVAREAIGPGVALFVDANGAYSRKQALALTDTLLRYRVTWYEQPVHYRDLEGYRMLRDRVPAPVEIASGEYGFVLDDFRRIVEAGAVDVLQADATRCGADCFLEAAALCRAFHLPLSAHTAPSLHLPLCCAAEPARHLEYFHDHVRIEKMLFDGVREPVGGLLAPDPDRPGIGIELKKKDAERYAV